MQWNIEKSLIFLQSLLVYGSCISYNGIHMFPKYKPGCYKLFHDKSYKILISPRVLLRYVYKILNSVEFQGFHFVPPWCAHSEALLHWLGERHLLSSVRLNGWNHYFFYQQSPLFHWRTVSSKLECIVDWLSLQGNPHKAAITYLLSILITCEIFYHIYYM